MINLKNDYCSIAHKNVLEKISKFTEETYTGYGLDEHTKNASNLIKKAMNYYNCDIHYLIGGTITNKVMISHALKPFEAVICTDIGHISVHETGTIEQSGHKIITVPNADGKITKEKILEIIRLHNDEHMVKPKLVYISNSTEIGSIYKYEELKEISTLCKENGLYLYMDGARLGSALTSKENDIKISDLPHLVDAFYIGGTKNGLMFGEALVLINDKLKEDFRHSIKHYGGLYAKGFITGIQFEALFEENLFYEIATHENDLANYLYKELAKLGVNFLSKPITNQIFCIFNREEVEELKKYIMFDIWEQHENLITIRFVTHFSLTLTEVKKVIEIVKLIKNRYFSSSMI